MGLAAHTTVTEIYSHHFSQFSRLSRFFSYSNLACAPRTQLNVTCWFLIPTFLIYASLPKFPPRKISKILKIPKSSVSNVRKLPLQLMMSVVEDTLIKPLEDERMKFYNSYYQPATRQFRRFSSFAELYKEDLLTSDLTTSTRGRKSAAQESLRKIARLSSSVLVLYCFCNTVTALAKKNHLEIIPKLRDWWSSVDHPQSLAEYAKTICEDQGIEYTEPPTGQGLRNRPVATDNASTGPVPVSIRNLIE